jgi:hypothetical protein
MQHSQIQKQLSAYLDEALSPQECEGIELHLQTCNECTEILSDLRQNRQWIAELRQPAPTGLWEAVQAQMANPNQRQAIRKFRLDFGYIWRQWIFRPVPVGISALVTVCLVLALVYLNPTQNPSEDSLDFYLMVHTEYVAHNPLTSNTVVDSFVIVEESEAESPDAAFPDDTQTVLDTYLDAYFGD